MSNDLDNKAREIMRGNDKGKYTIPTEGLYPYQWNWDSAFAALGFSTFDLDRAWLELETLFTGQWDNGMVPHIIFHEEASGYFPGPEEWGTSHTPPTSGISQPPVAATFARMVFDKNPDAGTAYLAGLFPKLLAWHRWFFEHRCEDGMIVVTHPWESGRDNALDWDAAMQNVDTSGVGEYQRNDLGHVDPHMRPQKDDYDRYMAIVYAGRGSGWDEAEITANGPFRVADPGMTFILLRANRDLLAMAETLGKPTDEIEGWITAIEAGVEQIWNPTLGSYDAKDIRTGNYAGSISSFSFLCWYAGIDNPEMLNQFDRITGAVKFSMPSLDPQSDKFEPFRYWRGPTWGIVNTLIAIGLRDMGHAEQAEKIRKDTATLIAKSGFAEYFNPNDGSPAGGMDFTWTAAIWLAWASPNAKIEGN